MDFEIKYQNNDILCSEDEIDDDDLDFEEEITELEEDLTFIPQNEKKSYVWKYFRQLDGETCECKICKDYVGIQINNLTKHLSGAHNISKDLEAPPDPAGRGRPSRSFIWKYCSRQNPKQALCHLCNKLLFFGGGNTSNIAKHLRRKHSDALSADEMGSLEKNTENSLDGEKIKSENSSTRMQEKIGKDKKSSYVWSYCEKVNKHTVRCKLCSKTMSFHGTANVITHLARRHRVNGKFENDKSVSEKDSANNEASNESNLSAESRRGGVWKFCQRISKDIVRCIICKKDLSFQGTSNLQRHLQRMHGIEPEARKITTTIVNDDIVWENCKIENERAKCNLCNFSCSVDEIEKHMVNKHAVGIPSRRKEHTSFQVEYQQSTDGESDKEDSTDNAVSKGNEQYFIVEDEMMKEDISLLDDMIEIFPEKEVNDDKEDIFDQNVEIPDASTNSSSSSSNDAKFTPVQVNKADTKSLQKLRTELVHWETECFREKAGYYRMQKYLAALQAKKIRLELENLTQNTMTLNDIVGATYTVDTSGFAVNGVTQ